MQNFRKNYYIYISIFAKKDETGSQNPTRQTRHSWRIGRQKWEGNERRKKRETEREREKIAPKKKQTTRKEGRNAMQES
jgi:hypothetical protein